MQESFGSDMKEAVERTKKKSFMEERTWYNDDDINEAIDYIKERLFDKNKETFYTPEAIFRHIQLPENIQRPIQQRLQSASKKKARVRGIKKIHRSVGSPFYGVSDSCPFDKKCFYEWCTLETKKYGTKEPICPRAVLDNTGKRPRYVHSGKEPVFVE